MFFRRARTPGFGTNGGGIDETDGNVYASPARLREENKKKKSIRRRVCKREERVRDSLFSVDIVKFMRPVACVYAHA